MTMERGWGDGGRRRRLLGGKKRNDSKEIMLPPRASIGRVAGVECSFRAPPHPEV